MFRWHGFAHRRRWSMALLLVVGAVAAMVSSGMAKDAPRHRAAGTWTVHKRAELSKPNRAARPTAAMEHRWARNARQRRAYLRSSKAQARREQSRGSYRNLDRQAAFDLAIRQAHGGGLAATPFRTVRPGRKRFAFRRVLTPSSALVYDRVKKRNSVLQSTAPLESSTATGLPAPTDLTIEDAPQGYRPKNAPTRLRIGHALSDGVSFDDGGFTIRYGSMRSDAPIVNATGVFYANSDTDTDTIITPSFFGAAIDWQLRSPRSPERHKLIVDLPVGARLVHASRDPSIPESVPTAIEIEKDGKALGYVYPPLAYDADGVTVPARAELHGNTITEIIDHRDTSFRYPISVDPDTTQTFAWGGDWNGWTAQNYVISSGCAAGYPSTPTFTLNNPSYAQGMYLGFPGGSCFVVNSSIQFIWGGPANTYIDEVHFFNHAHQSLYTLAYGGIYNSAAGWLGVNYQNGVRGNPWGFDYSFAGAVGDSCYWVAGSCDTTSQKYEAGTSYAVFGLNVTPYTIYTTTNCCTRATIENINTYLSEKHPPNLSFTQPGGGWTDDGHNTHYLPVSITDQGLGAKTVTLSGAESGGGTITNGCSGDWQHSPCPLSTSTAYNYTLAEGTSSLTLQAADIVSNYSAPSTWTERVDRSAPSTPQLGGTLYANREGWLTQSSYGLTMSATDAYSGVLGFDVAVDATHNAVSCTNPCSGNQSWTYNTPADGNWHTITVTANDAVNHSTPAAVFHVATDHAVPTISSVSHTGLPTDWTDDLDTPISSTVSVSDSESGPKTATLAAPGIPTKTQPLNSCTGTYSSPCPTTGSTTFSYSPTADDGSYQINEGDNLITATAIDAASRWSAVSQWHLKIDRIGPNVTFAGPLYDDRTQTLSGSTPERIDVTATDGSTSSDAAKRAGVAGIDVYLDGDLIDEFDQDCPAGNCSATRSPSVTPSSLSAGPHLLEAVATDQLGHPTTASFRFVTGPCCTTGQTTWGNDLLTYGTATNDLVYGDVNGDGFDDAVSRQKVTGQVKVELSNGTTGFGTPTDWAAPGSWLVTRDFRVADVNGDGLADAVGHDTVDGSFYVELSTGTGFGVTQRWAPTSTPDEYLLGHVNAEASDDLPLGADLVTRNTSTGDITIAYATGTGWSTRVDAGNAPTALKLALADVNGDGLDDLIAYNASNGAVQVGLADGATFGSLEPWGTSANANPVFGDVDDDGMADMLSRGASSNRVDVQISNGSGFESTFTWGDLSSDHDLGLADVDGDGLQDAVGRSTFGNVAANRSRMAPSLFASPTDPPDATVPADREDSSTPTDNNAASDATEPTPVAYAASAPKMRIMWEDDLRLIGRFFKDTSAGETYKHLHPVSTPAQETLFLQRMKQAGATDVRFFVFWGRWINDTPTHDNGYREAVTAAVDKAVGEGLAPYITLTGANGELDDAIGGQETGIFYADGLGGFSANASITPATFRDFVESAVSELKQHGVHRYAIWNEPNLPSHTFLTLRCPASSYNHRGRITADLYRVIYKAGYAGVSAQDSTARVFIGELSEQVNHGRRTCGNNPAVTPGLTTDQYLKEVANDASDPLKTYGVAWHPYQHLDPPTKGQTKGGKATQNTGISMIARMTAAIKTLRAQNKLYQMTKATPHKKVRPGLYITEFGYLNRPTTRKAYTTKTRRSYHPEWERRNWYRRALALAGGAGARMFSIYEMAEQPPSGNTNDLRDKAVYQAVGASSNLFDTGLVHSQTGSVTGDRDYGWGLTQPKAQPRSAYCGIQAWVKKRLKRSTSDAGCP